MSDISGLELRKKACEALGWTKDDAVDDYFHHPKCKMQARSVGHLAAGCTLSKHLPAIESDPAVSEPMFLEWCAKNEYVATGAYNPFIVPTAAHELTLKVINPSVATIARVFGSTPSEARARAIVAATEKH